MLTHNRDDLRHRSVQGPYALVVGPRHYRFLATFQSGYPLVRQVERLIEGPLLQSDLLEGGILVSTRGGAAEPVLGADFGVGYEHHTTKQVHLFVAESFTFRVLDPTAFIPLKLEGVQHET
ncbi:MAG TPA: family 1 encapsulin nanocompartment shell protein [Vicinamibacteria bacterium]|nr:family 1 encapsulin nanocompartment shell protein [Vicinamibacteria bacterium]